MERGLAIMKNLLLLLVLVKFMAVDGGVVYVNPESVTALTPAPTNIENTLIVIETNESVEVKGDTDSVAAKLLGAHK
jgi:hypothetical protein